MLEVRAGAVASELQMAEERPNTRVKFVKLSHFPIFEMPLQVAEDILSLDTVRDSPTLAASALEGGQDAARQTRSAEISWSHRGNLAAAMETEAVAKRALQVMEGVSEGTVVTVLLDGSVVIDCALDSHEDRDWPIARLVSFVVGTERPSAGGIRRRIEQGLQDLDR